MKITAISTRIFHLNEDLVSFITTHVKSLPEGSILLVTSKIISLAEGQIVNHSETSKKDLVKKEADIVLCESYKTYLTIKNNILIPAAGIDESNAEGKFYILWPKDPYQSAKDLWLTTKTHYQIKKLGIILTDSRCTPLRKGVSGVGISYWGFKGVDSHIGKPDIFNRPIVMSTTNIVDGLAAAGVLVMGESNEQKPLALIENFEAEFCDEVDPKELIMPPDQDIFGPVIKMN
ncbi:MAG: coenzyme F420-0:L-glutamate ligase [Oligoflexia bacterium]|nr:coenzyme F420-0:L-glutamate ligase [Oligoflexia bacterium]